MSRPRALDLFCGAGGVSVGLERAGFDVTGVDIKPQPRYRGGAFIQADALTFPLDGYDFIWASPPCQAHTALRRMLPGREYVDLIPATREKLAITSALTIIENVPGAPLREPFLLCGSMFGLQVRRHRLFEASFSVVAPDCQHDAFGEPRFRIQRKPRPGRNPLSRVVRCYGGGAAAGGAEEARKAMGIDWMNRAELSQAIPPAYAEWIGRQALEHLRT